MNPSRHPGPLKSRFGRRLLLLFVGSTVLPTAVVATLSYRQVTRYLVAQSETSLHQASKAFGAAIFERLLMVDATLKNVAASPAFADALRRPPSEDDADAGPVRLAAVHRARVRRSRRTPRAAGRRTDRRPHRESSRQRRPGRGTAAAPGATRGGRYESHVRDPERGLRPRADRGPAGRGDRHRLPVGHVGPEPHLLGNDPHGPGRRQPRPGEIHRRRAFRVPDPGPGCPCRRATRSSLTLRRRTSPPSGPFSSTRCSRRPPGRSCSAAPRTTCSGR